MRLPIPLRRLGYRGSILALPDPLDPHGLDDVLAPPAAGGPSEPRLFLKAGAADRAVETLALLVERRHNVVGVQFRVGLGGDRVPQLAESLAAYAAAGFELSGSSPAARRPDGRVTELDYTMVRVGALPD